MYNNKKEKPIHFYVVDKDTFMEGTKSGDYVKLDEGAGIYNIKYLYDHIKWSVDNGYNVEIKHGEFSDYETID